MRLTKKQRNDELSKTFIDGVSVDYLTADLNASRVMNKLGQLEDVEDELGIDLITLFKALKNGVYIKKPSIAYHYVGFDLIEQDSCGDYLFNLVEGNYYFKDYGKTWVLTKEELL